MSHVGLRFSAFLLRSFFSIQRQLQNSQQFWIDSCSRIMADATSSSNVRPKSTLDPPVRVRGMKILDRQLFEKRVRVPCVRLANVADQADIGLVVKSVKRFLLKMDNLKPVRSTSSSQPDTNDSNNNVSKVLLLNPDLVSCVDDLDENVRRVLENVGIKRIEFDDLHLSYANFKSEQVLDAVLQDEAGRTTGYSRIGHIVHVNLRENLLEYRHLIGQVLLDKLSGVTCVVNKTDTIETEFRNFKMEVLASDGSDVDTMVHVRENGCQYDFDFARVFWNPRLSTEHERLAALLPDVGRVVLYDVFAGVGPFAVPAARRRKCRVLANDLNPDSFRWLEHNVKLNKVADKVTCYNLDGRDFIRDVVAKDIADCLAGRIAAYRDDDGVYSIPNMHVAMNLPALAVQFLNAFRGLFRDRGVLHERAVIAPTIHCYAFVKTVDVDDGSLLDQAERDGRVVNSLEEALGRVALDRSATTISFVRKVAPNKDMVRATFQLPLSVLFEDQPDPADVGLPQEPDAKKARLDDVIQE